ncbi:MAG: right-handed parallel beta-helix repeat-containing protein [Pseudomonadota bacterium]|nr:right-handed parallel beta-helix repeat-containing protein [Pseudomonadota bacterium]
MIKKIRLFFGFSGLVLVLVLSSSRPALAATLVVDDDRVECPNAGFTTIQGAVDVARRGDRIRVCPGTYNEQIGITEPLSIIGNNAVVKPSVMTANTTNQFTGIPIAAVILVRDTDVTISGLTIDGGDNRIAACEPTLIGIFYQNASGRIRNVDIMNMKLGAGLEGCQSGLGIFAQKLGGRVKEVRVETSRIHGYQKNGITATERGTKIRVDRNTVTGIGPTVGAAQNGIQIGFGATGEINRNVVMNHIWSPCVSVDDCAFAATGLAIVRTKNVSIRGNTVGNSQCGICLSGRDEGQVNVSQVIRNTVFGTLVFDGIALTGNNNEVGRNIIIDSSRCGILVNGDRNEILRNRINGARCGVLETPGSTGNVIRGNRFVNARTQRQNTAREAADPTAVQSDEASLELFR